MKLAVKLLAAPWLLVILLTLAGATQLLLTRQEEAALREETSRLQRVFVDVQLLQQSLADAERDVVALQARPTPVVDANLGRRHRELGAALFRLSASDLSRAERQMLDDLAEAQEALGEARERLGRPNDGRAPDAATVPWRFAAQRASGALADLSTASIVRLEHSLSELSRVRTTFGRTVLILTVVAGAIAAAFALWVMRQLLRPLNQLTAASQAVGRENHATIPALALREDELGVLAKALREMAERLTATNRNLEEALRARDQFLSIAAHELKTPLTSLGLQLSLLRRETKDIATERAKKSTDVIERQHRRISQLVDELLDVSRIHSGKLSLERETVALQKPLEEAAARCLELLESRGSRLTVEVPEGLTAFVDVSRLDQLVVNLLSNAAKYAPGAAVRLSARAEGNEVVLEVAAVGPGIPADGRAKLFEPYARSSESEGAGMGLGLFICKELVEAHGGTIRAVHREPGTLFEIRLPGGPGAPAA